MVPTSFKQAGRKAFTARRGNEGKRPTHRAKPRPQRMERVMSTRRSEPHTDSSLADPALVAFSPACAKAFENLLVSGKLLSKTSCFEHLRSQPEAGHSCLASTQTPRQSSPTGEPACSLRTPALLLNSRCLRTNLTSLNFAK